jgi:SHS2 domain-containing protein
MSRNYKFVDHTADIAVELDAGSLEELFIAAAEAFKNSVTDFNYSEIHDSIEIEIEGNSIEELLVNFLNEINFYLTTKKWLCCSVKSIKIFNEENEWELSAELSVIKLRSEIELKQEIKSVTYHQMEIAQKNNIYSTRVVFDI